MTNVYTEWVNVVHFCNSWSVWFSPAGGLPPPPPLPPSPLRSSNAPGGGGEGVVCSKCPLSLPGRGPGRGSSDVHSPATSASCGPEGSLYQTVHMCLDHGDRCVSVNGARSEGPKTTQRRLQNSLVALMAKGKCWRSHRLFF